jgi:hypothetical protein
VTDSWPAVFTACFMWLVVGLFIGYGLWGPT